MIRFNHFRFRRSTVAVHCKDTRIAVQVRTNKPFNGRIYALGRSETCNIDVINSDAFRLDLTMGGQDCNTQSIVSELAAFVIDCVDCTKPIISDRFAFFVSIQDGSLFEYSRFATSQRCHDESR